MTQVHFTLESEDIQKIIAESGADKTAKTVLTVFFNQLMEKQRDDYIQADSYERTDQRKTYRNGYYDRDFTTRVGTLELRVPRTRDGKFDTNVFESYQRSEKALILTMMQMVISGVSTRNVTKAIEIITDGHTVSKSFVSTVLAQIDPIVSEWRQRRLNAVDYPFVMCDALYTKVRENQRVVSKGVYITLGFDAKGNRSIIGLDVKDGETQENWSSVFQGLKERGLSGVKMVISDAHLGLIKAVKECFLGAAWQRCQAHFLRNIFDKFPKKISSDVKEDFKAIFKTASIKLARERKQLVMDKYGEDKKIAIACKILDEGFEDAMQVMVLPENIRRRLRTTNVLERLNEEVRRRERVVRIFPNCDSVIRIIGALLMEKEDEWTSASRKYLEFDHNEI
jgi:putative transposase